MLIYERIREEVRAGRTALNAIDAGFTRALATILDSNITTFIAAAVLFYIGTGPVRGFAVTLGHRHHHDGLHRLHPDAPDGGGVGALVASANCSDLTVRRKPRAHSASYASSRTIPNSTSCASGASAFPCRHCCRSWRSRCSSSHGLNLGVDFVGGTLMEIQSKSGPADLAKMRCDHDRAQSR